MVVADTKVPIFKDHFWHFQIKIKLRKKITRQGSVRLPGTDFFWIIPCSCYLGLLDKVQKQICETAGPSHPASLEPLADCRNMATISL